MNLLNSPITERGPKLLSFSRHVLFDQLLHSSMLVIKINFECSEVFILTSIIEFSLRKVVSLYTSKIGTTTTFHFCTLLNALGSVSLTGLEHLFLMPL